ncbi:MAG: phage tail sheath family protein [Lewinellaceae bacterium]|nr:phage tail sheath family protein [Lewinellaceae bacterium]
MEDPRRPGVYIEEIALLPPSVAGVSTAVPAFLGYTRKFEEEPQKITSLLEFTTIFGEPFDESFTATNEGSEEEPDWKIQRVDDGKEKFWLYYLLKMFFNNGGRVCYVISVGTFTDEEDIINAKSKNDFIEGLKKLEKEDEPTLIVLGEAASLDWTNYKPVLVEALDQCGRQKDRFAIIDVLQGDEEGKTFRGLASDYLRYGAAYTPFLRTSISYELTDGFEERVIVDAGGTLKDLKSNNPEKYNQIRAKLNNLYLALPPSGAMAGVYARVDQERGVWKAPANVGVMSVIAPDVRITDLQHDALNYHPGPGKSINAIRNFTGRGTLVWGARTLDGNSNEWRYIPVRRLFNFIEESIQKATGNFVFEPNNATTWLKVKGMIESFLFDLWQKGALAGPTPEAAYFVHVGLGKTMSQNDILNGKMIVDVGVAAVRPAEFIMLRFSHKMQEAA